MGGDRAVVTQLLARWGFLSKNLRANILTYCAHLEATIVQTFADQTSCILAVSGDAYTTGSTWGWWVDQGQHTSRSYTSGVKEATCVGAEQGGTGAVCTAEDRAVVLACSFLLAHRVLLLSARGPRGRRR